MPSQEFLNRPGSIWERYCFPGKTMETIRREMDETVMAELCLPAGVTVTDGSCGGQTGRWVKGPGENKKVMYYIHGGGFTLGSSGIPMPFLTQLAARLDLCCFSLDYRLAPEHKFPAAPEDCLAAYKGLLEMGFAPEDIAVCGESAGASLSLVLLHQLKAEGLPYPACVIALSPVTDGRPRAQKGDSKVLDALPAANEVWNAYAPGEDLSNPLISPALGDLTGFPPVFILAGGAEMLVDDALIYMGAGIAAGMDLRLTVGKDMIHTYPLDLLDYPEAMEAFEEIVLYLRQRLTL